MRITYIYARNITSGTKPGVIDVFGSKQEAETSVLISVLLGIKEEKSPTFPFQYPKSFSRGEVKYYLQTVVCP